jgi:hypothetical protein
MNYLRTWNQKRTIVLGTMIPGIVFGLFGVETSIYPAKVNAALTEVNVHQSIAIESLDRAKYDSNLPPGSALTLYLPSFRRNIHREIPPPSVKPTESKPRIFSEPSRRGIVTPPSSKCPTIYSQSSLFESCQTSFDSYFT